MKEDAEKTVKGFANSWYNLTAKTEGKKKVSITMLSIITIYFAWIAIGNNQLFGLIYCLCALLFVASIFYAYEPIGTALFYGGIILFIGINYIFWIIPILIGLYLFYRFLDTNRKERIKRIAHMTPAELSGVRYQKPNVEIIIRGGRRK